LEYNPADEATIIGKGMYGTHALPLSSKQIREFASLSYISSAVPWLTGSRVPGTVYEGRCRGLRVAIKVLNDQKMDAKSLRKFKDEVELMAYVALFSFHIEARMLHCILTHSPICTAVRHRHHHSGLNHTRVVLFLGACMLENGKVACVTEYLPNGTALL
jgi:hypothetical protein